MNSISFEPLIPSALWAALAVAAAVAMVAYSLRRPAIVPPGRWGAIVGLMSLSIGLVLLLLLNPTWVVRLPPPIGKPLLSVLVDSTRSMAVPDGAGGSTRYQQAAAIAQNLSHALGEEFEVRVQRFAGDSSAVNVADLPVLTPNGKHTDLAAALTNGLDLDRPQGQAIVLLSDGIDNVGGGENVLAAARLARSLGAGIYCRPLGSQFTGVDLAVEVRPPQDLAFVGQRVPITARVSHVGIESGSAEVSLLENNTVIEKRNVDLHPGVPTDTQFWVSHDKPGIDFYEVRVTPLPTEITQANNSASYMLRVVDQPIRVLLLEGKPYWDSKFLARTLGRAPAVELETVVKLTENRLIRRTIAFGATTQPSAATTQTTGETVDDSPRVDKWTVETDASRVLAGAGDLKRYQVIVLGRDAEAFLGDQAVERLQSWIARDGGSLVCFRGSPTAQIDQRLGRLLPVRWEPANEARFHMQMTQQGRDMNWLGGGAGPDSLAPLPALVSTSRIDHPKPLAVVLATAVAAEGSAAAPAAVYQPYGSGRVVVIEGAGMWRWAFLPPQFQEREAIYVSLWQSLLRWLVSGGSVPPGQTMALRADKVTFADDEPATATLAIREDAAINVPIVKLIPEGSAAAKDFTPAPLGDAPGAYRVDFGTLPQGRYRAAAEGAAGADTASATVFEVRDIGTEDIDLLSRPDLMARVAQESGGALLASDDSQQAAKLFREHLASVHPPRFQRNMAWDRWWLLVLVLATWAAAWALRRSSGLV